MKLSKRTSGVVVLTCLLLGSAFASDGGSARTFWWKVEYLDLAKEKWLAGDEMITLMMDRLIGGANSCMTRGPFSVMDKEEIPPSGDKHDYLSYGAYWWPNPDTNDGLPWIHRDGYVNPDNAIDGQTLKSLYISMLNLSLGYYFTEDETYAEHAAHLLRIFFLDEETLMYPRTRYAQVIPGVSSGTCEVVAIASSLRFILEGAGILERSPFWSEADKQGLQQWCQDYLNFMETEPICDSQRDSTSNHGTNYDFLAALMALYIGDEATARQKILSYVEDRMPEQISSDGSNPVEMLRANNLQYHCFNLDIIFRIARLGENLDDIDLWHYEMEDGRGPKLALEFLIPYITGQQEWVYWPGEPFPSTVDHYFMLLRNGALAYNSFRLERYAQSLDCWSHYYNLVYPWFAIIAASGDFEPDGDVDTYDLAVLASAWSTIPGDENWNPICDISEPNDNIINMLDLSVFLDNWLDFR